MDRRTFNAASLATLLTLLPRMSYAQENVQDSVGYQFAEINDGRLTAVHKGMATSQIAVDDDTLFQVASCSKTVTALAVLTLVRDGYIELDQPVNKYLQRWQLPGPRGATTTIVDLMSHTAGTTVHGFNGYSPDDDIPNILEILMGRDPANSSAIRTSRRLFRRFRYSGGGTMVLQTLIEDVTGIDFARYTAKAVLIPIGASHATFAINPSGVFAHGFYEDGQPISGAFRRHPESAAAGLWATASDLARIMNAILLSLRGAQNAIVPVELARRMVTPLRWRSGLGVFVIPNKTIWHEGRNHGFDSIMVAELETGKIRTAVTNQNGAIESYATKWLPD